MFFGTGVNACSENLRKEVVDALDRGTGKSESTCTFEVGLSSVKRYAKAAREGRSLAPGRGCELLFLPPYSPDLNPVEEAFTEVEALIRRAGARTQGALNEVMGAGTLGGYGPRRPRFFRPQRLSSGEPTTVTGASDVPFEAVPKDVLRADLVRETLRVLALIGRTHFGTTPSGDGFFGGCVLYASEIFATQIKIRCSNVLLEVVAALGSGYRDDILTLREQPCQGKLAHGNLLLGCNLLYALDELEILPEVFVLEPRLSSTLVIWSEIFGAGDPTGKESPSERTVSHESYSQLANGREDFILHVPAKKRVLGLKYAYGMNSMRPANKLGFHLRKPKVADLPRLYEIRHGAYRLFYGRLGIYSMLVVEVYVVDAEALQRGVAGPPHVLRPAVDTDSRSILLTLDAALGGEDNFVAPAGYGLANELFVGERPIHICRVD